MKHCLTIHAGSREELDNIVQCLQNEFTDAIDDTSEPVRIEWSFAKYCNRYTKSLQLKDECTLTIAQAMMKDMHNTLSEKLGILCADQYDTLRATHDCYARTFITD